MEKLSKEKNKISKNNIIKASIKVTLLSALILSGANKAEGKILTGTTSQKQAIEQLIKEGKLLPNFPTDFRQGGIRYSSGDFWYNLYLYGGEKRQRYETDNLRDIEGKNIAIDNDVDSCTFLLETIYKNNFDRIIPIIIDRQIDTIGAAPGEYERIDWENSKDFTGSGITVVTGKGAYFGTHMNAMADVMIAKKNNFTEEDYDGGIDERMGRQAVGMRPGKARLYVQSDSSGKTNIYETFSYVCNEALSHPDKRYILSCSWTGGFANGTNDSLYKLYSKLGAMDNVIIFTARTDAVSDRSPDSYAKHPATIEVGYVQAPELNVLNQETQQLSFAGEQKDWIVNTPGQGQTGKMTGDAFCVLGEWTTSGSTAALSAIAGYIRAQNPDWTKDEVIAMLKRDVYKPMPGSMTAFDQATQTNYTSNVTYDVNGWNERFGYGIVQPGKTMKENIFPEINETKSADDGEYQFTVSNRPSEYEYTVAGEGIMKDDDGYSVDLSKLKPGKHTYTFLGQCLYGDSVYAFPISRTLEIAGPEAPMVNDLSGNYKRVNDNPSTGKIRLKDLDGKLTNYQTGDIVDIELNGVKIENIMVNVDGSFDLSGLSDYPFPFDGVDIDLKITYTDAEGNKNRTDTKLPVSVLTGKNDMKLSDLKVYPNPVQDVLHIDLGSNIKDVMVKIYNVSGKMYEYKQFQSGQNELNLSGLQKGMYFVTITDKSTGLSKTEKIVKL